MQTVRAKLLFRGQRVSCRLHLDPVLLCQVVYIRAKAAQQKVMLAFPVCSLTSNVEEKQSPGLLCIENVLFYWWFIHSWAETAHWKDEAWFWEAVRDICVFQFDWFMTLRRWAGILDERCFLLALKVNEAAADCVCVLRHVWCRPGFCTSQENVVNV